MVNQEKLRNDNEHARTPEVAEVVPSNHERHEVLHEKREQSEHSKEDLEDAKKEALKHASSVEKFKLKEKEVSPTDRRKDGPISKPEREASYKRTMKQVQSELSTPSRTFSKLIHNKTVEKTSDAIGGTIARPNAILSGAFFAFGFSLILLLTARYYGYPLSGTETIAGFLVGWAIGTLFDYLRLMITGKKS
jgi:hypothetical protein